MDLNFSSDPMTLPYLVPAVQEPTTGSIDYEDSHLMRDAALAYAQMGWWVFALSPFSKMPRRDTHGLLDATNDPDEIRALWADHPWANIGVDCGRSRIVVVDVDPRNGGDATLALWEEQHGPLRTRWEARTAGGGRHFYFRLPDGADVPRTGKLGVGVDLKAGGGYVIAPPSRTLYGEYAWV